MRWVFLLVLLFNLVQEEKNNGKLFCSMSIVDDNEELLEPGKSTNMDIKNIVSICFYHMRIVKQSSRSAVKVPVPELDHMKKCKSFVPEKFECHKKNGTYLSWECSTLLPYNYRLRKTIIYCQTSKWTPAHSIFVNTCRLGVYMECPKEDLGIFDSKTLQLRKELAIMKFELVGEKKKVKKTIQSHQYVRTKRSSEIIYEYMLEILKKSEEVVNYEKSRNFLIRWWMLNVWYTQYTSEDNTELKCHPSIEVYCKPQPSRIYMTYLEICIVIIFSIYIIGLIEGTRNQQRMLKHVGKLIEVRGPNRIVYKQARFKYYFEDVCDYGAEYDERVKSNQETYDLIYNRLVCYVLKVTTPYALHLYSIILTPIIHFFQMFNLSKFKDAHDTWNTLIFTSDDDDNENQYDGKNDHCDDDVDNLRKDAAQNEQDDQSVTKVTDKKRDELIS